MNKKNVSDDDMNYIVNKFPSFELSYDKILHKKVFINNLSIKISEYNKKYNENNEKKLNNNYKKFESDILLTIIPKGKKYIIWFTTIKENNKCYLIDIDKKNIISVFELTYCYDNELSYNTILYGTLINKINDNNTPFFTCEDIFYYKNKNIQNYTFNKKIEILNYLFKNEIRNENIFYKKDTINITLPIMRPYDIYNINDAFLEASYLPYNVYGINIRDINLQNAYGIIKNDTIINNVIFKVKACVKQDIYSLYCNNENNDYYYGIAYIPDYKTSVFMNSIFRTIKENKNLDLLEESDDDEEFENVNENKFVDLDKSILMMCTYIEKFRKWKPIKIINKNEINSDNHLITKNELHEMMKVLINNTKDNINYAKKCQTYIQNNNYKHNKIYNNRNRSICDYNNTKYDNVRHNNLKYNNTRYDNNTYDNTRYDNQKYDNQMYKKYDKIDIQSQDKYKGKDKDNEHNIKKYNKLHNKYNRYNNY